MYLKYFQLYVFIKIIVYISTCHEVFNTCEANFMTKQDFSISKKPDAWNTLGKHAYSNKQKISPPKTKNFQIKNSDIFHISALNIDCGYSLEPPQRGGSNEYPQCFQAKKKKEK